MPIEIPGYEDAIREERRIRDEIFATNTADIFGVTIFQVTPKLLARLRLMGTPFISGGEYSNTETLRFLWALSVDFVPADHEERSARIEALTATLVRSLGNCFTEAENAIDLFLFHTFMDGPSGGKSGIPYVTSTASFIYQMGKAPFGWDMDRTINAPLRLIYQLIRCQKLDEGANLGNEISDRVLMEWRNKLQAEWEHNKAKGNN